MDTTLIIALAGIAGTLAGSFGAPVISERVRRRGARDEKLFDSRLEVYADLLQAAAQITDNAQTWLALPLTELDEPESTFLDPMLARIRRSASDRVYAQTFAWKSTTAEFYRALDVARVAQQKAHESGAADTDEAIRARLRLADLSDALVKGFRDLESAIRRETT